MELLERELEKQAIEFFDKMGLMFYKPSKLSAVKNMRMRDRGAPDGWIFHKGTAIAVEFKTRVGRQSEEQKAFQRRLEDRGISYYVLRSLDDCNNLFRAIQLI